MQPRNCPFSQCCAKTNKRNKICKTTFALCVVNMNVQNVLISHNYTTETFAILRHRWHFARNYASHRSSAACFSSSTSWNFLCIVYCITRDRKRFVICLLSVYNFTSNTDTITVRRFTTKTGNLTFGRVKSNIPLQSVGKSYLFRDLLSCSYLQHCV